MGNVCYTLKLWLETKYRYHSTRTGLHYFLSSAARAAQVQPFKGVVSMKRRQVFSLHTELSPANGAKWYRKHRKQHWPNALSSSLKEDFCHSLERLMNLIVRKPYLTFSLILFQPISPSYYSAQPKKQFLTFPPHWTPEFQFRNTFFRRRLTSGKDPYAHTHTKKKKSSLKTKQVISGKSTAWAWL